MVPQEQESLIWLKLSQLRLIQRSSGRQLHIHYALLVPFNLFCVHYFHIQQNLCVHCYLMVYFSFHKLEAFVVSLARPISKFTIWGLYIQPTYQWQPISFSLDVDWFSTFYLCCYWLCQVECLCLI
jgi:hypothetical protein